VSSGSDLDTLPQYSGTPADALSAAGGTSFLYVLTNWGFARASLADPANPTSILLGNVGLRYDFTTAPPTPNGGKVPINCDCAQGGSMMAVAESPGASARMFSDWRAAMQGGGLPGQVGRVDGALPPAFAQQVNVPQAPIGTRVAAIHLPASGKFIGYFPTDSSGVKIVDATSTNGDPAPAAALSPFATFTAWPDARLLEAGFLRVGGLPRPMLAGVNSSDGVLRLAEIHPTTGVPAEVASLAPLSFTLSVALADVNNRAFLFSAEVSGGIQVYEYSGGALVPVAQRIVPSTGYFDRVFVRGGRFPAVFAHRVAGSSSFIEIWDTVWLTQGGAPRLARSLQQRGASGYREKAMEAIVKENGPAATAYIYRLKTPSGLSPEHILATDTVDITCITFDPSAPPVANGTAANISAQARGGAEAAVNYYGDRWRIRDASSTGAPLDRIEWDWNTASAFSADPGWGAALPDASFSDVDPAYFPCDPSAGGDVRTGANCRASLGLSNPPSGGSYRFALQTRNANGWSGGPFVSAAMSFVAPQARVAGLTGGVLTVLSGGQADATPSQGNTAEAAFAWTFSGGAGGTASGSVVTVPPGATGFALTVSYPGGYAATVSGSINQVDLIPDFTLAPNPAPPGGSVALTNQMRIGSATLDSVESLINQGTAPSPFSGAALAPSFHAVGGQASITAPAASGSHNVHLKYNYTASGQSRSAVVSRPLTVVESLAVVVSGPATAGRGVPVTFVAAASGGTGGYEYAWKPGEAPAFETYRVGTSSFTYLYAAVGTYTVTARVRDSSLAQAFGTWTITVSPAGFYTVTPCRLVDTRGPAGPTGGPALDANSSRSFPVTGQCGIPASARAVSINVTVTQPATQGNLRLYPGGAILPLASAINYGAGQTRANNGLAALGATGELGVRCDQPAGTVHLLIDVNGYFE